MDVTTVLIYLIIAIVSLAVYLLKRNLSYWKRQGIPHDEPHSIMGNMLGMRTKYHVGEIVADYYHKFKGTGPFAGFYAVHRPAAVILDKDLIKNVLIKDFNSFSDRGVYHNDKDDPLTANLFLLEGQKWRTLRQKLSPTFTSGKMKYMYPNVLRVADELKQVLSEQVKENPIVDIRDFLGRFTTDIIGSAAFGIECNSLRNPNSEFPILGKRALAEPRHNALIMALIDGFPKLARKLGMRILREDVHQFFMKSITDTINYREKHNIQRNDFLNLLIELKNNEKSDLAALTIEEMCAQVFIFFLGGFETSSSTMTLALHELAQNQELQDRLREEVNEVFEKETGVTYESLNNMTYLNQVISETLRKYPVFSVLNRQAIKDYVVPGHPKYVIKAGVPVFIPVLGIQHDPEFYPNPEIFDPERFAPELAKERDSVEWMGFGDGPRNCIGERFGKMQTRLGIATAIHNFRFKICSKTEIPVKMDPLAILYVPKNVVYLELEAI